MGKKYVAWFKASMICYTVSAVGIALIAFTDITTRSAKGVFGVIAALIFYLGLLAGIAASLIVTRMRQGLQKRVAQISSYITQRFPGVITFRRDIISLILYTVFAVGMILTVVDLVFNRFSVYVMLPVIALTYLAFIMHCIVDGKNYKIYKLLKKGEKYGDKK